MKAKYLILFSLSGLVICLDQLMKYYALSRFYEGEREAVIPGFLSLTQVRHSGFAFGMLERAPSSLQDVFFIGVPVFALILIVLIFIKLRDNQMLTSIALSTILGGAVGNLIDRLQYGYVVDVILLQLRDKIVLPAFNVADVSIVLGVSIMIVHTLIEDRTHKPTVTEGEA